MSLFPKFKIPTDTPAILAIPATISDENSGNSENSNPQATPNPDFQVSGEDDPILSLDAWYPVFKEFHHRVVIETPNFDYLLLKEHRPDLYQAIKVKEAELDSLRDVRLSEVTAIMHEWRTLVLQVCFEKSSKR